MRTLETLLSLACGRPLPEEDAGPARRLQLALLAALGTAVFAAIYGALAGSTELTLALGNLYKLPMVMLLSSLVALPGGLLAWRLLDARRPAVDLLLSATVANLSAALVLAVLGPLVALYYHTSSWLGVVLALVAASLALLVGVVILLRTLRGVAGKLRTLSVGLPATVLLGIHLLALLQFIAVASPILPETTVLDGGADTLLGSSR